jgi:3-deoxy-manno-octulosonate cytidylyltransferase (CMP-KDO synthetase)
MIVAVIPARFASVRLPGKPLIDLEGQSMIERVWRAVSGASVIGRTIVATDDERIANEVHRIGGEAVLTDPTLPSGTDRCFEALTIESLTPDVVVNVQCDEPLLESSLLDGLVEAHIRMNSDATTIVTPFHANESIHDEAAVKVVRGSDGRAMYFSRSAIPFVRGVPKTEWSTTSPYWKHIGVYVYSYSSLRRHVSLAPSHLEKMESLEQLRLLQDGAVFQCFETDALLKSVDTPDDAERVREILRLRF